MVLPVATLVQKHITYGSCYILDSSTYFQLKSHVASKFGVHPNEVLVVGSGKLGFSIVHEKRYRPFGDSPDIDVTIISPDLFDKVWIEVFDYWRAGGYSFAAGSAQINYRQREGSSVAESGGSSSGR